jgi:molybdopterin biosynthesis enzyme MoaB
MTAVEWLIEQLFELRNPTLNQIEIMEQAKETEKQQIIEFADKYDAYVVQGGTLTAERYYNKTFKQN